MKVAVLSISICPYTIAIINHFESHNIDIESVIIETDIREKFSEPEIKFRNAHDKFNLKLKKYGLSRRIARQIWDTFVPKFIKRNIYRNAARIPFVKKISTSNFTNRKNIRVFSAKRHSNEEVRRFLIENKIDYVLLGSSNWLLKKQILTIESCKIISIHPGLLPDYRGLDSLQWAIKNDGKIGNTAFFINESLDEGDILKFYEEPILVGDTTARIQRRMTSKKPAIYIDVLKGLESKTIVPQKQSESKKPFRPMSYEQLLEVEEILQHRIQSQYKSTMETAPNN